MTYVLLRAWEREDLTLDDVVVVGVYDSFDDLEAKVNHITRVNPQYPMVQLSGTAWRIGPDEDEGFFGYKPMNLRAVVVK